MFLCLKFPSRNGGPMTFKEKLKKASSTSLEHVCVDDRTTPSSPPTDSYPLLNWGDNTGLPQRSSTIPLWKECLFLTPSCRGSFCLLMRLLAICSPPRSKSLLTFAFVFFYRCQIAFCENVNQGSFWIVLLNAVLSKISEEFFKAKVNSVLLKSLSFSSSLPSKDKFETWTCGTR